MLISYWSIADQRFAGNRSPASGEWVAPFGSVELHRRIECSERDRAAGADLAAKESVASCSA
jgi:hypothetical protein